MYLQGGKSESTVGLCFLLPSPLHFLFDFFSSPFNRVSFFSRFPKIHVSVSGFCFFAFLLIFSQYTFPHSLSPFFLGRYVFSFLSCILAFFYKYMETFLPFQRPETSVESFTPSTGSLFHDVTFLFPFFSPFSKGNTWGQVIVVTLLPHWDLRNRLETSNWQWKKEKCRKLFLRLVTSDYKSSLPFFGNTFIYWTNTRTYFESI